MRPPDKGWLGALVAAELARHDPIAALASLPPDVRAAGASSTDLIPGATILVARSLRARKLDGAATEPAAAFVEEVRRHVTLLLDLAVLRGVACDRDRRRAEIATFVAAAVGDDAAGLGMLPVLVAPNARDVERAFHAAEQVLAVRFHPPGDPVLGLPLHSGAIAILRRRLVRIAVGFHRRGRIEPEALERHARYADRESVLLVEALAGLFAATGGPGDEGRAAAVRARQIARLGLSRAGARAARAALAAPRSAAGLAHATPERVRPFLVEQLFLALLRARLSGEEATRFVERFVSAARLDPAAVVAARVEAAAQHGDHHLWFEAFDDGVGAIDWQALADELEAATDAVVERVSSAVSENVGAVVREIRETGELGQLLARAAGGATLTAEERRKVRAQLIDLAKAIPALAIFAAPGGMLLLPLLAKLLPFNLLPSAWDRAPQVNGQGDPRDADEAPPELPETGSGE